jgi:hypothetical protein
MLALPERSNPRASVAPAESAPLQRVAADGAPRVARRAVPRDTGISARARRGAGRGRAPRRSAISALSIEEIQLKTDTAQSVTT